MVDRYFPEPCGTDDNPCTHGAVSSVWGKCPACGSFGLSLHGQIVQCGNPACPDRLAAYKVLHLDHRHVVDYGDTGPSIEHPVTCRLGGKSLHDCPVWRAVLADGDIGARGRYYVELEPSGLSALEPVSTERPTP